jgi:hypothetical protein
MLPDPNAAGAVPPPPPPPPPPAQSRAWLPWALGLVVLAAAAVALVLIMTGGDDSSAASTSTTSSVTTTLATTTTGATTSTSSSTTTSSTTTTAATTTTAGARYSRVELDFFAEIAGQVEYGGSDGLIHKWAEDVRLLVIGNPTRRDRTALDNTIADLNALIAPRQIILVEDDPNLELYFAPESEFATILPEYVPVNMGYIYIWWDDAGAITRGVMLVSTTGITADERAHLIREELTQSLGLLADTTRYENSIFYQEWTTTNRYSPLDRTVIEMLYLPEILPGMTLDEALAILEEMPAG